MLQQEQRPGVDGDGGKSIMFVAGALCDYGLTAPQYRVIGRIARRGECWEAIENIAKGCRLDVKTVRASLKFLLDQNLIRRSLRTGMTTIYTMNPMSVWKPLPNGSRGEISTIPTKAATPTKRQGGCPTVRQEAHPYQTTPDEGNPFEGNPIKVLNGVAVAPPPSTLSVEFQLDRKGKRVLARLLDLVPDAAENMAWWGPCLLADAASLSEILDELSRAIGNGGAENPGAWVTAVWKARGGEAITKKDDAP